MTKEERIVALYRKGRGVPDIAKTVGYTRDSAYQVIRDAGILRGAGRPGCEERNPKGAAKFNELRKVPGISIAQAAREAGIAYYVGRYIARKGQKQAPVQASVEG